MSTKSKKKETSLFSSYDRAHHGLTTEKNDGQESNEFYYFDGQYPYFDNNWTGQQHPIWYPYMEYMPYNQYPPGVYYPPYDYQTVQPVQPQTSSTSTQPSPTSVSKTPANKPSAPLPRAPLGRTPREPTVVPSVLGATQPPIIAVPDQQTIVPPAPQIHYSRPPPPPTYYHPHSPPSPHYYRRSSGSPFYYSSHPPQPHYYEGPSLPPIPRRESRREYDYYDRHYYDDPYVRTYSRRHYDSDPYRRPRRWYD